MPSFRILDQFPVYLDRLGVPVSGGSLRFYESGTDTPKDVYGDPDLTVNNGSEVVLSSDGRTTLDVWGSGAYRVRLYAIDGTLIKEADNVEIPGGTGTVIPALLTGYYLTNDGSSLIWAPLREVPDPTGQSGKFLSTDGTNLLWQPGPTIPDLPIDNQTNRVQIGSLLIQWGSDSAPATSTRQTAKSVNFPTPFGVCYNVIISPTTSNATTGGQIGVASVNIKTNTGFTIQVDTDDWGQENASFVNPHTFDWVAFGSKPAS